MTENKEYKKELSVKWIKTRTGQSYLCPVTALDRLGANPREEQLRTICVDESSNPQND